MRLGFSFLYFTPRVRESHAEWFGRAAHHGYEGVELPVQEATADEIAFMRDIAAGEGLATTAVGFATADANPIAADPALRARATHLLIELVDKATALGANVLAGPVHSAYGRFSGFVPTADERSRCVDVLRTVGEHAENCGVVVALEPLNRFECYFLNSAAACNELVRRVDHPNVVSALDTHHAVIEEPSVVQAIDDCAATLGHVQLSENHRGTPGTGHVPFAEVLEKLRSIDYAGWLVVEAFSRYDPDLGSMLRIWRDLDEGPEAVMAAGAALVKER